ncbi:MAG: tRNA 2-selenouridine(34) synthase MnmH [Rubellimicrobium sp.]|nr:tRNA 2-selenouridine(34) synthase MnmH [Rubellimicrobium sp.]
MAITLRSITDPATLGFDDIIDVRSPAEFARDHLPGAISLPVLDDAERARVGTQYVQVDSFTARKTGAAMVARNAARHIDEVLIDRPGNWRALVYCWRGGMRSNAFATILSQIGWRVEVLAGGYKAWRRLVVETLTTQDVAAPVVLLDGNTGSAKTDLLAQLRGLGLQVIDLEGLARHRGSVFGHMGAQPAQAGFDTGLALELAALDPARPVVIEAESARIGGINLPARLWAAMKTAPRVAIRAPLPARAAYLARAYADVAADPARLAGAIDRLRPLQPATRIDAWHGLAQAGAFEALASGLMEHHYDPRYARQRAPLPRPVAEVTADDLSPAALPALAGRVADAVHALDLTR